jgi:hypothetical protein
MEGAVQQAAQWGRQFMLARQEWKARILPLRQRVHAGGSFWINHCHPTTLLRGQKYEIN